MPQVTIDIPPNTIAVVREFMETFNSRDMSQPTFTTTTYTKPAQQSRQYFPTYGHFLTTDWEDFRNELEFE